MDSLLIMILAFAGYILMYNLYGKYIGRHIFALSKDAAVPSKQYEDGQDYVPTKKEVIFGHHFTSIAGTGPIVGPAIAIIWGWAPTCPLKCRPSPASRPPVSGPSSCCPTGSSPRCCRSPPSCSPGISSTPTNWSSPWFCWCWECLWAFPHRPFTSPWSCCPIWRKLWPG
jgi:hypothetical protein